MDSLSEAVVQAADQAVEEVALGGGVPVADFASAVVVGSGAVCVGHGGEGPDVADAGQALVLDAAGEDGGSLAGGSGDRGCSGVGLESSGVAES